jgi:hypothetical protein
VLASTAEGHEDEDYVHLGVLKMILMEQLKVQLKMLLNANYVKIYTLHIQK